MAETNLGQPIPTRYETDIERFGMPVSEILRRSARFTVPKFLTGEIDIHRITSRKASAELLNAASPGTPAAAPLLDSPAPSAHREDGE